MARKRNSRKSRTNGLARLGKPNGIIQPRVQVVGPQRFGVVAVDCAKARSKWINAVNRSTVGSVFSRKRPPQGLAGRFPRFCVGFLSMGCKSR